MIKDNELFFLGELYLLVPSVEMTEPLVAVLTFIIYNILVLDKVLVQAWFFKKQSLIFFYHGFLSLALTIHRAVGERRGPSLFFSTTSTRSRIFRHLLQLCMLDYYHVYLIASFQSFRNTDGLIFIIWNSKSSF